jgi:hypothetical protein
VTLLVMAGLQQLVRDHLPAAPKLAAALDIALVGAVGGITYLAMAALLHITEVTHVLGLLRGRLRP